MALSRVLLFICFFAFVSSSYAQCDCGLYTCGCCVDGIPLIHSVCANVTWNADAESITVEVTAGGATVIEQTFTDDSPLSVCAPVPGFCKDVCIEIQNLNITDIGACGTIVFNATCFGTNIGPFSLGDFYLGKCQINGEEAAPEEPKVPLPIKAKMEEIKSIAHQFLEKRVRDLNLREKVQERLTAAKIA